MMLNKVQLIGNLGRDPEIRTTQSGTKVANLSVATTEKWRNKDSGEVQERTEWHRVVSFDERASEYAEKYLRTGSKVYVEGQLQTRKWTDQNGQDRYSTEVVIQRFKGQILGIGPMNEKDQSPASSAGDLDNEIPF